MYLNQIQQTQLTLTRP